MSEKKEKEVCIDLSKKIKFWDNYYVSIGTLILSLLAILLKWLCTGFSWWDLWFLVLSLRSGTFENEPIDKEKKENTIEDDKNNG